MFSLPVFYGFAHRSELMTFLAKSATFSVILQRRWVSRTQKLSGFALRDASRLHLRTHIDGVSLELSVFSDRMADVICHPRFLDVVALPAAAPN